MAEVAIEAVEIAEELLRRTGDALISGDFQSFGKCFLLPHRFDTLDGQRVAETTRDLTRIFDDVRAHFLSSGVTQLVRTCVSCQFSGPDKIYSMHESRLFRRMHLLQQPYPVLSLLRCVDGEWKIAWSSYAIIKSPVHSRAFENSSLKQ